MDKNKFNGVKEWLPMTDNKKPRFNQMNGKHYLNKDADDDKTL